MKMFYILDTFTCPTGYNHMFMALKVARGFGYNGFKYKIVENIDEVTEPGFVLMCDHPMYYSLGFRHNASGNALRYIPDIIQRLDKYKTLRKTSIKLQHAQLKKLGEKIGGKEIVVIAWNRHWDKPFFEQVGLPVIYIMEAFQGMPGMQYHKDWYKFYHENKNAFPLKFAADADPNEVGKGCRNDRYTVSYVGAANHHRDYYSIYMNDPKCKIVPTPPFITEEEKRQIYSDSKIGLGLHHSPNLMNKMVAERVFEVIAQGAVCVTDHPYASKATDGSAVYVKDREKLIETVDKLLKDNKRRASIRAKGLAYIRRDGTWAARAKQLIKLSNRIYGTHF